jgi:5-methylcytosine-specific restriction endonuclease McrA
MKKIEGIFSSESEEQRGSNYQEYQEYLRSSQNWSNLKEKVKERDRFRCTKCGSNDDLEVHHKNYDRFKQEKLEDLITLCKKCHIKHHKLERSKKIPEKSNLIPTDPETVANTYSEKDCLECSNCHSSLTKFSVGYFCYSCNKWATDDVDE